MSFYIAAISLGLLGSFHCIGMCGPIALSLPLGKSGPLRRILLILLYNAGRMITYACFGLLFGVIGQGFVIGGYQQLLSILIGSVLLISVVIPPDFALKSRLASGSFKVFTGVKSALGKLFLKTNPRSLFFIGLLNGLLPCGLVYMGVSGAVATGDPLRGAAFMALFGAGTVPAMLSLPLLGNVVSIPFRNSIRRTMPLIVGAMAVLLIFRGLNLGIPYVSPKIVNAGIGSCHSSSGMETTCHKTIIPCSGQSSAHKK